MLYKSNRKPDLTKNMLWTDSVHLTDSSCFIHEPFNFDSRSDVISAKQFGDLRHWEYLISSCIALSIVPPTISTLNATKARKRRKNKRCELNCTLSMQKHWFSHLGLNHSPILNISLSLFLVLPQVLAPVLSLVYPLPKSLKISNIHCNHIGR